MISNAMSSRLGAMALLLTCATAMPARAQQSDAFSRERAGGNTGIGVALGDLTGVSVKLWTNEATAFQFRLGSLATINTINSAGIILTYAHHFRPIEVPDHTFSLPMYVGMGARYVVSSNSTSGSSTTYMDGGIATVLGLSVMVPGLPLDIFLEVRPTFLLYDPRVGTSASSLQVGFLMDSGIGAHFYY